MSGELGFREYSLSASPHKIGKHLADLLMQIRGGSVNDRTPPSVDSTANATTASLSPYFAFNSLNHFSVERHGGHLVARNSTSTGSGSMIGRLLAFDVGRNRVRDETLTRFPLSA
jgi:hypothetical protein